MKKTCYNLYYRYKAQNEKKASLCNKITDQIMKEDCLNMLKRKEENTPSTNK